MKRATTRYGKFGRGGCFTCTDCGRLTRETDRNAGLDGFCGDCAELAQLQNGFSDTPDDQIPAGWAADSLALRKAIIAAGGKLNDSMTWAEKNPLPLPTRKDGTPPIGTKAPSRRPSLRTPEEVDAEIETPKASSKAAKARAWNALVREVRNAGGTIPSKGIGWTAALRAEANRYGLAEWIPNGCR